MNTGIISSNSNRRDSTTNGLRMLRQQISTQVHLLYPNNWLTNLPIKEPGGGTSSTKSNFKTSCASGMVGRFLDFQQNVYVEAVSTYHMHYRARKEALYVTTQQNSWFNVKRSLPAHVKTGGNSGVRSFWLI